MIDWSSAPPLSETVNASAVRGCSAAHAFRCRRILRIWKTALWRPNLFNGFLASVLTRSVPCYCTPRAALLLQRKCAYSSIKARQSLCVVCCPHTT